MPILLTALQGGSLTSTTIRRQLIARTEVPTEYPFLTPRYVTYLQTEGVLTPIRLTDKPGAKVFYSRAQLDALGAL